MNKKGKPTGISGGQHNDEHQIVTIVVDHTTKKDILQPILSKFGGILVLNPIVVHCLARKRRKVER